MAFQPTKHNNQSTLQYVNFMKIKGEENSSKNRMPRFYTIKLSSTVVNLGRA